MDPVYEPLLDYGLLGIFLVIVLGALVFTVRFVIKVFRERQKEFVDREANYEEKIDAISKRLDQYIDNDHKALINALENHSSAYRDQAQTNRVLYEKLMSML